MRRGAVVAVSVAVLLTLSTRAVAAWGDSAAVTGALVSSRTLATASLTCTEVLVGLTDGARISWTPTTAPTTISYSAQVLQTGNSLTVSSNSSVTLTASLLSSLLGTTVTVRIRGSLPGTGWTTTADHDVSVGLAGLWVNCA